MNRSDRSTCIASLVLVGVSMLTVGCGGPGYEVAPARGVVLLDGQPFTSGKVMFAPKASGETTKAGKVALGNIQPDGAFVLSTYGSDDGAVVAEHAVTVLNTHPESADGRRMRAKRVLLPGRLEVVAGQPNEFTIELTADIVDKYGMR